MSASHRRSMSGLKVEEAEKWGRNTARSRYGSPEYEHGAPPPKDQEAPQGCGDPGAAGARPKDYFNDHPNNWVRGRNETAENKPGYLKGYRGK
jgi:hypothetical protein